MASPMTPEVSFSPTTSRNDNSTVALDLKWPDGNGQTWTFSVESARELRAQLDNAIRVSEL